MRNCSYMTNDSCPLPTVVRSMIDRLLQAVDVSAAIEG